MPLTRSTSVAACLALATVAACAFAQEPATATAGADPLRRPSETLPLASRALILDLVRAGDRIVAVGERGHVLVSDDGTTWRQVAVPLRTTLTAASAVGKAVWAVGHDGVILHSADAGDTWTVQREDAWKLPDDGSEHDLRQGVPLLDVLFTDAQHGIAIGAYSLLLSTSDGGKTWSGSRIALAGDAAAAAAAPAPAAAADDELEVEDHGDTFSADELRIGEESEPHLNAIARTGSGAYVIVGERGAVFHSRDGATWERSRLPYDGSMFGVIGYDGDHVLAFGLRGNVFESTDLGTTWTAVPTQTELSLMGGVALPDGGAAIVGANGTILHRARAGDTLARATESSAGIIAGVLPAGDGGALLIAGENGIGRHQPK